MFTSFNKKSQAAQSGPIGHLIEDLRNHIDASHSVNPSVAKTVLSLESATDSDKHALNSAADELATALESIAMNLGMTGEQQLTDAQKFAAVQAGILAADYKGYMSKTNKLQFQTVSTEGMHVVMPSGIPDAMSERSVSLEAYDERENRNAVLYSMAYNMQAARQDEFGETLFPTLNLAADQVGFGVVVNLMTVYDAIERKVTGEFQDFNKKNIIRAVADSTVLRKEQTRVVPVHRGQAADKFVDPTDIAPRNVVLEGETIATAPLKFGQKLDLIGLSQTDTLIAGGVMDMTDTLDPAIRLQSVYLKTSYDDGTTVSTDILKINTLNLPLSEFTYSTQNNYRVQTLNFQTTSILLNKDTKNVDGSPLSVLDGIVTDDLIVRLEVQVSGTVNIETGETTLFGNIVGVHSVKNAAGEFLPLDEAPAQAIVDAIASAKLIGYEVEAWRANANARQRGQLIDVTRYTQLYNVPLRSPIAKIQPINTDGQTEGADLQALITATRIRTSNEAVTALIQASQQLNEYVDDRDMTGVGPDVLGVGRFFIRPFYHKSDLDMATVVDSIKSHERAADIQAAIVNKVRDIAYRMYRDTEYKAAADALTGGIAPVPTVVIATDPVLARYLNVTGDLRTLGGEFNVRVVSTLDTRVSGKIFITFGVFDETRNTAPNPLNFGNMVWAPEFVLSANISRGNTISKELIVQPRFRFFVNLPALAELTVQNVPDVIDAKVPVDFHNV